MHGRTVQVQDARLAEGGPENGTNWKGDRYMSREAIQDCPSGAQGSRSATSRQLADQCRECSKRTSVRREARVLCIQRCVLTHHPSSEPPKSSTRNAQDLLQGAYTVVPPSWFTAPALPHVRTHPTLQPSALSF
jgi:hypothetical protein